MNRIRVLTLLCFTTLFSVGCGPTSLADRIVGKWVMQSVDGKSVPHDLAERVLEFRNSGLCRRGEETGEFKVIDSSTVQTEFGGQSEVVTVEVKGDMLIMRTDTSVMQAKRLQ